MRYLQHRDDRTQVIIATETKPIQDFYKHPSPGFKNLLRLRVSYHIVIKRETQHFKKLLFTLSGCGW